MAGSRQVSGGDEIACHTRWHPRTGRPASATRNAMQAAAISPRSSSATETPGAAHYIIHSFDDPDHAILVSTRHALTGSHRRPRTPRPSHIFVQLGMWDDVVASNIVAYKAAVDLAVPRKPSGREFTRRRGLRAPSREVRRRNALTRPRRWPTRDGAERPRWPCSMKARGWSGEQWCARCHPAVMDGAGLRRRGLCVRGRRTRASAIPQANVAFNWGDARRPVRVQRLSQAPFAVEKEVGVIIAFNRGRRDRRAADRGDHHRDRPGAPSGQPIRSSRRSSCMATSCST